MHWNLKDMGYSLLPCEDLSLSRKRDYNIYGKFSGSHWFFDALLCLVLHTV
jgi:hypothetical protein